MTKFFYKILIFAIVFISINSVLLFLIPKDKNNYLCEYNHKVKLLKETPSPRIIFIGGSSIAFGTNSKAIKDSLHRNIVNFGLHAGIGIKYPLEDCLDYIRKGDIIILQMEYQNFFSGGNGEPETFLPFMIATNWRNIDRLNSKQWYNTIIGVPQVVTENLKRLMKYPLTKSFNQSSVNNKFEYVKSGFNEFGDEVSHLQYPNAPVKPSNGIERRNVDKKFVEWLKNILQKYEKKGARVIMLPPVCIASHFRASYNDNIFKELNGINRPYAVAPQYMVLDDSCIFNGGYHVNGEGVKQNTKHIVEILKKTLCLQSENIMS